VKVRWATIMRPSRSMRHLIGKADSKLMSGSRMGCSRSLSARANPHRNTLGTACQMCGGHEDTVSHMLQCEMVKGDLRVEEAFDQLFSSMEGRTMKSRGDADDVLELTELVQWTRNTHQGSNAHKVLLGNCDLRCVPSNMRRMYMQMQLDPRLHNLWLQGCVGVLRAAWACHDAKVADLLQAAAAGGEPEQDDQGEQEDQPEQNNKNSQQVVRNLVSGFCSIVPNRAHGQSILASTRAEPSATPRRGGWAGQLLNS